MIDSTTPHRGINHLVAVAAAAADEAGERGDAAAEDEPRHGRSDQHLPAVLVDLLAPVGDLGHLGAQALDGEAELGAVRLDGAPDLLRRARRRHQCATSPGAWRAPTAPLGVAAGSPVSVPLISCASSIASFGVGGEPFLMKRIASSPASSPTTRISTPVIR